MAAVAAAKETAPTVVPTPVSEWRPGAPSRVFEGAVRPAWRVWAIGLAAAACLLIAVMVGVRVVEAPQGHNEQTANNLHEPVVGHPAAPEVRHETAVQVGVKRGAHRSHEARLPRLPKKELFPTPQPLSPELQALAQFVARAPEAQRRQLVDAQAKLDAPITIAPLQIAPLKESDEDEH